MPTGYLPWPDAILGKIVSYLWGSDTVFPKIPKFDQRTLYALSQTCKYLRDLINGKAMWEAYYRTLRPGYWEIAKDATHIGKQTYLRCTLGSYPGWANVNNEIPTTVAKCCKKNHYDKHVVSTKGIRAKDLPERTKELAYKGVIKKIGWGARERLKLANLRLEIEDMVVRIKELEVQEAKAMMAEVIFRDPTVAANGHPQIPKPIGRK